MIAAANCIHLCCTQTRNSCANLLDFCVLELFSISLKFVFFPLLYIFPQLIDVHGQKPLMGFSKHFDFIKLIHRQSLGT